MSLGETFLFPRIPMGISMEVQVFWGKNEISGGHQPEKYLQHNSRLVTGFATLCDLMMRDGKK